MTTRIKMSFVVWMTVVVATGCSMDSSIEEQYTAEKMLYKAGKLYQRVLINPRIARQLDYNDAIAAYRKILHRYAKVTHPVIDNIKKQCFLIISELWLLQGEVKMATEVYDDFLAAYPEDNDLGSLIRFANAKSNERLFNLDKAISEYQILIDDFGTIEDPSQPSLNVLSLPLKVARLERSGSNGVNGNDGYQEALAYYSNIVATHPGSPAAFVASFHLASIHGDQQQWRKEIRTLTRLVKDYPDRPEIPQILLSVGNIYLDGLNNHNESDRIFTRLLQKYPEHQITGYVHFAKSRVLIARRRLEEARKLLSWIIENFGSDQNLCSACQLTMARTYEDQGNWERALVEYRWVQEKYPTTPQGLFVPTYIAQKYQQQGDMNLATPAFQDAISHYSNLIKKFPRTVLAGMAQEYIIYCHSAQENWEQALTAASNLEHILPGTRSRMKSTLVQGQLFEKMRQFDKAAKMYEEFTGAFPNHPIGEQIQERIRSLRR